MNDEEIRLILQNHKDHLRECRRNDDGTMNVYWIGALDCVDNLAGKLGVELE